MKNLGFLSAAGALAVLFNAHAARADHFEWSQQPGYATAISVGPRNIPWVIGGGGHVYYGSEGTACGNGICVGSGQEVWHDAIGGVAANVAVSMQDQVGVSTAGGTLYMGGVLNGSSIASWPSTLKKWLPYSTQFGPGGSRCVGQMVISAAETGTAGPDYIYGMPCGGGSAWLLTPGFYWNTSVQNFPIISNGTWQQIDTNDAQVALFSVSAFGRVTQNPWTMYTGHVYAFNGASFVRVVDPKVLTNLRVSFMTDTFVVATGLVYQWTGDIYGHGTGNPYKDWKFIIGPTTKAPIAQIAYAPALTGPNWLGPNTIGPSDLWALDTAGNIYKMITVSDTVVK